MQSHSSRFKVPLFSSQYTAAGFAISVFSSKFSTGVSDLLHPAKVKAPIPNRAKSQSVFFIIKNVKQIKNIISCIVKLTIIYELFI
jgi:hypothetical protein